jgi:malate dehydrogenase
VPVVIGASGVEKVVIIELDATEKAMLQQSGAAVRELIEASARL